MAQSMTRNNDRAPGPDQAGHGHDLVYLMNESARTRLLIGLACRALGDEETALLELEHATAAFEQLGALPDLARVEALARRAEPQPHGLTKRELEELRLVAAGRSKRESADSLFISVPTVKRHLTNILGKLGLPSRSALNTYAHAQGLV